MESYTVFRESNPKNRITIKAANINNLRKKLATYIDAHQAFKKKPAESIIVGKTNGGSFKKLGEMYLDLYCVLSMDEDVIWQISNVNGHKYYLVSKKNGNISRRKPYEYSKRDKKSPEYQRLKEITAPTRKV